MIAAKGRRPMRRSRGRLAGARAVAASTLSNAVFPGQRPRLIAINAPPVSKANAAKAFWTLEKTL